MKQYVSIGKQVASRQDLSLPTSILDDTKRLLIDSNGPFVIHAKPLMVVGV